MVCGVALVGGLVLVLGGGGGGVVLLWGLGWRDDVVVCGVETWCKTSVSQEVGDRSAPPCQMPVAATPS